MSQIISKKLAIDVMNAALSTGADYAEIYAESSRPSSISIDNGKVDSISTPISEGAGIRLLKGVKSAYGYTSDLSRKNLLALAGKVAKSFEGERLFEVKEIKKERVKAISPIETHLNDVSAEEKIAYLKKAHEAASSVDPRIVRVTASFISKYKTTQTFVAENEIGHQYDNVEERGRVGIVCIAKEGEKIESAFTGPARYAGWEWFTQTLNVEEEAKETAKKALMLLDAKECPSGRFTVVVKNGWGGVLFHEACGHSLEATATAKGLSVFSKSIDKQIASPIVSAYDDGTLPNEWGSNNIDSEGHKTQKNQLIKDGVCVGFLVDKLGGRRLGMEPNGCSRREDYSYAPTSRMSNTYIAPGKDDPEDIIKDTKLGIYVANFGGGSVEPTTGEFNFSASEAYIIRDGKICEPVKGCTLIGTGAEVLMNIDRVGNDLALGEGNCGSLSGSIPVDVGQPTVRIREITVGGRGGKLE